MKRDDVYVVFAKLAGQKLKRENPDTFSNDRALNNACRFSYDSIKEIVDNEFKGVYKPTHKNFIFALPIILIVLLFLFYNIVGLVYSILISLIIGCIYLFAVNKGFNFILKDMMVDRKSYTLHYKPKLGRYEVIIIGKDKDKNIHVFKFDDEEKKKLDNSQMFIADKETLSYFIHDYTHEKRMSFENCISESTKLVNSYYYALTTLKKSDIFNK